MTTSVLVLEQSPRISESILANLHDNLIETTQVSTPIALAQTLLETNFDFIICCIEDTEQALHIINWLKSSLAIPFLSRTLVFTTEVSREDQREALLLGVAEFYDVAEQFDIAALLNQQAICPYPSKILLVEDNRATVSLLTYVLAQHHHQVVHHNSADGAYQAFIEDDFDLVVTDLLLEGKQTGQELIMHLKENGQLGNVPVLAITAYTDPAVIVDLLQIGVTDVLRKPIVPEEFLLRVELILKATNYQKQLEEQSQKVMTLALTDPLTGSYNRRFMENAIKQRINDLHRKNEPFSVMMIDIDDFKRFNDQFGHLEGDKALIQLSELVRSEIRSVDCFCRFGGEEFVLILSDCDRSHAIVKAEQFCQKVAQSLTFTVSIGVTICNEYSAELSIEAVLNAADSAVYEAKKAGKNQVMCL